MCSPPSVESSTAVTLIGLELRAEALGLVAHLLHQRRTHDPRRKSGKVLNVSGLLEQTAPGPALDNQRG